MVAVGVMVGVGVIVPVAVGVAVEVGVGVGVGSVAITDAPRPAALNTAIRPIKPIAAASEWLPPVSGRNPIIASVIIPATMAQVRCMPKVSRPLDIISLFPVTTPIDAAPRGSKISYATAALGKGATRSSRTSEKAMRTDPARSMRKSSKFKLV